MLKKYEFVFVIDVSSSSEEVKVFIENLLKSYSMEIIEKNDMGIQNLSYPINKKEKAIYYLLTVESDSNEKHLSEFTKEVSFNQEILRFIKFNVPKEKKKIKKYNKKYNMDYVKKSDKDSLETENLNQVYNEVDGKMLE